LIRVAKRSPLQGILGNSSCPLRVPQADQYSCAGRWKGTNVAVKILSHGVAGAVSNIAVAREKMIGLASVHPNVVSPFTLSLLVDHSDGIYSSSTRL